MDIYSKPYQLMRKIIDIKNVLLYVFYHVQKNRSCIHINNSTGAI